MIVEPPPAEDGGGYLASVPDLSGRSSGGERPEEAVRNLRGAIAARIEEAHANGRPVPAPLARLAVA